MLTNSWSATSGWNRAIRSPGAMVLSVVCREYSLAVLTHRNVNMSSCLEVITAMPVLMISHLVCVTRLFCLSELSGHANSNMNGVTFAVNAGYPAKRWFDNKSDNCCVFRCAILAFRFISARLFAKSICSTTVDSEIRISSVCGLMVPPINDGMVAIKICLLCTPRLALQHVFPTLLRLLPL